MSNINPNTGIRYGTIYLNNLNSYFADELFNHADNITLQEGIDEVKVVVKNALNDYLSSNDIESVQELAADRYVESAQIEEPYLEGECDGVKYGISWLGGAPLLWIFESPYTIKADLCSPCLPGAGNLNSLNADGYECYDIPKDWRDESH